jgi:hypothetical protein
MNDDPTIQWHGSPGWRGDHSFFYDRNTDTLHIGDSDYHHYDLAAELPSGARQSNFLAGYVYDELFDLTGATPEEQQRVMKVVQQMNTEAGGGPIVQGTGEWSL